MFVFFKEYLREAVRSAIFMQKRSQQGENCGFIYAWAEYYLQHSWTTLRLSRPLVVGSDLQVLAIEKEEKLFATNDNEYVLLLKLTKIQYKNNAFISNLNVA